MNCIWILLLLCCCGHGNGFCGNCAHMHNNDCENERDRRNSCEGNSGERNSCERNSCERNSCERNSCERNSGERNSCERDGSNRNERQCSCENNSSERIAPPFRQDFGMYGRNDRRDDWRDNDYDRRDRGCETCGCEAE